MALQLSAYFGSIANTAADQQIPAIADGLIYTRDNAIVVPPDMNQVLAAFFFGTNLTTAKFKPASYRRFGDYWVLPYSQAIAGAGGQQPYLDLSGHDESGMPLVLSPQEELPAYAQQSSAGAQNAYAFVLFGNAPVTKRRGKFFTVRATGTTTLVANAWTAVAITLDTGLPTGRYSLVGARCKSAGCLAFRFIIIQQHNRPGGFGFQGDQVFESLGQRNGGWGEWGQFDHLTIPTVEFWSTSADTSETIWMDVELISEVPLHPVTAPVGVPLGR
jgi:hypothetical protein